jgi:hypothetical protein
VGVSFDAGKHTVDDWRIVTAQPPPSAKPAAFHAHPALLLHNTGKNSERNYHRKGFKNWPISKFSLGG